MPLSRTQTWTNAYAFQRCAVLSRAVPGLRILDRTIIGVWREQDSVFYGTTTATGEMAEVFAYGNKPNGEAEMTALAYYMAAVCQREREHVPIVGPSTDRRTLTLVCRLANGDTIRSLICFMCGQIHTSVSSWEQMYHRPTPLPAEATTEEETIWRAHCGPRQGFGRRYPNV